MQKIKYLLVVGVVLLTLKGITQNLDGWQPYAKSSNRLQGKLQGQIYYLSTLSNANFFLQKDWVTGSITLTDGDVFSPVKLRYMSYGDELVAYNDNVRTLFIVEKNTVKEFTYTLANDPYNREIKFINLDSLNLPGGKSYFEELYDGSAKLLVYHFVNEVKVTPFTDNTGIMRDSEFRPAINYFLLNQKNELFRIQRKKASFYKVYPEHKKEIRKLFRKNRISLIDQNSLIQAFNLLDEAGILK